MKTKLLICSVMAMVFLVASPALAELEQLTLSGELRILWESCRNTVPAPTGMALRWPASYLIGRSIGTGPGNGDGIPSYYSFDGRGNDYTVTSQWVRLRAEAQFTEDVAALIELDSVYQWGADFRSDYLSGTDFRGRGNGDVEIYQAFIEADNLYNLPLRLRIGRQELVLGSEWLVGNNDSCPVPNYGLSFDALRLTWTRDPVTIDAFASLLAEGGISEQDGDVMFCGLYGSSAVSDALTLDMYWLFLRDARSVNDTRGLWFTEWVEDLIGLDDYDPTTLHTVGLRGVYTMDAFSIEAEAAWQTGYAGQQGSLFTPWIYGDDDARFNAFGVNLDASYAFDRSWSPTLYAGYTWLSGEDHRDLSFWDWLNPFDQPRASLSFNRLFSDHCLSDIIDLTDWTNVQVIRGGICLYPTEAIEIDLCIKYLRSIEPFDAPVTFQLGQFQIPVAPVFSFWTRQNSRDLGIEASLYVTYTYSEDLEVTAGYARLFPGDGLRDGGFTTGNGLEFDGGNSDDHADYISLNAVLSF